VGLLTTRGAGAISRLFDRIVRHATAAGLIVVFVAPLVWMVLSAFKPGSELLVFPPTFWPREWFPGNFLRAFSAGHFGRAYINSLVVAACVTFGVLLTSSLAGFAFARYEFRGRKLLFMLFLSTMMVPAIITLIPSFIIVQKLGWLDTYRSVVIPTAASAFGIFLLRQHASTIPSDYFDSAQIDGASAFRMYAQIMLPLCRAPLSALTIFTFVGNWDSFFWPLLVLQSAEMKTIPVALADFRYDFGISEYNLLLAATAACTVPALIVYLFFQRYIVQGVSLTGIKG